MKYYEVDFYIDITGTQCSSDGCGMDADMFVQDVRDIIAAYAGEIGFETFEDTDRGVKGYIQVGMFDGAALAAAMDELPFDGVSVKYDVVEAEDKDWNEQWETEGFEPIVVNDNCVIHDGRHKPDGVYPISVEIDAKLSFGTGTHETTKMMVATLLDMNLADKNLLDCGCGTGILGIVALKCGAASVTGYDIDEWSVDNSMHNAIINMVDGQYGVLLGDASVLASLDKKYDVVVANINRNILLADMASFVSVMKTGAYLLLSGFYIDDMDMLKEKADELGLCFESDKHMNDWACMAFRLQ